LKTRKQKKKILQKIKIILVVNGAFYVKENAGGHSDLLKKRSSIDWAGF